MDNLSIYVSRQLKGTASIILSSVDLISHTNGSRLLGKNYEVLGRYPSPLLEPFEVDIGLEDMWFKVILQNKQV